MFLSVKITSIRDNKEAGKYWGHHRAEKRINLLLLESFCFSETLRWNYTVCLTDLQYKCFMIPHFNLCYR